MLTKFSALSLGTFVVGYLLSLWLFKIKRKKFSGSTIQTKVLMWVPIFFVVLTVYAVNNSLRWVLFGILSIVLVYDFTRHNKARFLPIAWILLMLVVIGSASLWYIASSNKSLFLFVWYISVLSDVGAYFVGNFYGRHQLPKYLNNKKSWEGVAGQLFGAVIGFVLLKTTIGLPFWWLWIVVGIGCASGDLLNSYVKREVGIKDWGSSLPGHGGFLDRMSSIAIASLLVVVFR